MDNQIIVTSGMKIKNGKIVWSKEEVEGNVEYVVHPSGVGWLSTPYGMKMSAIRAERNRVVNEAAINNVRNRKTKFPYWAFS